MEKFMTPQSPQSHHSAMAKSLDRFGFTPVRLDDSTLEKYRALALDDQGGIASAVERGRRVASFVELAKVQFVLPLIGATSHKLAVFVHHLQALNQLQEALGKRCRQLSEAGLQ
jgi:hypothetical protein